MPRAAAESQIDPPVIGPPSRASTTCKRLPLVSATLQGGRRDRRTEASRPQPHREFAASFSRSDITFWAMLGILANNIENAIH